MSHLRHTLLTTGSWCSIELNNRLLSPHCDYHSNKFHCPDTTNLHTHGLHVSSEGAQDNIAVRVLTGGKHVYNYTIPEDHLMGTFWYHAHMHGSSLLQIMGGMHGAIDMLPSDTFRKSMPAVFKTLYDTADTLVLSHVHFAGDDMQSGFTPNGSDPALSMLDYTACEKEYSSGELTFTANPRGAVPQANVYVVNGRLRPTIRMAHSQAKLLRIVHAGGVRTLELSLGERCGVVVLCVA
jgi:FtsP/CotA-like multicopper oxidase with cupredoxin domain